MWFRLALKVLFSGTFWFKSIYRWGIPHWCHVYNGWLLLVSHSKWEQQEGDRSQARTQRGTAWQMAGPALAQPQSRTGVWDKKNVLSHLHWETIMEKLKFTKLFMRWIWLLSFRWLQNDICTNTWQKTKRKKCKQMLSPSPKKSTILSTQKKKM